MIEDTWLIHTKSILEQDGNGGGKNEYELSSSNQFLKLQKREM